jgi:sepiapterin reductase
MSDRLFIITGASRGIGKAITHAIAASSEFSNGSMTFILTSTKHSDLDAAKLSLEDLVTRKQGHTSNLHIFSHPIDFSEVSSLEENLNKLFSLAGKKAWDHIILMMNHGSLGGLQFISNVSTDLTQLTTAINVNITSCIMFASIALKAFSGQTKRLDLVNISSKAAVQAFPSWGVYCVGKAARDMLIEAIASEISSNPDTKGTEVRALNYAPGPVNTDMQKEIRQGASVPEQREFYTSLFETGKLVAPEATSAKLVSILEANKYDNGAHIDFFDD